MGAEEEPDLLHNPALLWPLVPLMHYYLLYRLLWFKPLTGIPFHVPFHSLRQKCIPATFKQCLCGSERTVFSDDHSRSSIGLSNSALQGKLENTFLYKSNIKSSFYKKYEDLKFFASCIYMGCFFCLVINDARCSTFVTCCLSPATAGIRDCLAGLLCKLVQALHLL